MLVGRPHATQPGSVIGVQVQIISHGDIEIFQQLSKGCVGRQTRERGV